MPLPGEKQPLPETKFLYPVIKRVQDTQEIRENAFSSDKTEQNAQIFEPRTTEKQTINSLSSCQLDARMLAEGKKGTESGISVLCRGSGRLVTDGGIIFFPIASLPASNRHKLSKLIVCFSVFMLYVA